MDPKIPESVLSTSFHSHERFFAHNVKEDL